MMPTIQKVGQLMLMTAIIMIMIFAIKKLTKNVNIPAVRAVVDEV